MTITLTSAPGLVWRKETQRLGLLGATVVWRSRRKCNAVAHHAPVVRPRPSC